MAVSIMTRVWEHSQARGNGLLLLLAIADHANEHGAAWPGFRLLQRKTKIQNRQTITNNLRELEISGELIIQPKKGPHGTHWYQVCSGMPLEKVDAWRTELGLPPRNMLSLDEEIEDDPVQPVNHIDGEKVVTELNHESPEVVTELNHPETGQVVQSGYESGSIPIGGGSVGIRGGHTVEPKPLLTVNQQPSLNQYLTADFDFLAFKRVVLLQLPKNSTYAAELEACELHGVGELDADRRALVIQARDETTARLFQSRLQGISEGVAQGIDPTHRWEVIYGWQGTVSA